MKLVICQDKDSTDLQKGEAIAYIRKLDDGSITKGLIFGCPKCGKVSTGSHIYNDNTQSLSPSIVCGYCGYHGHLRNGEFTE